MSRRVPASWPPAGRAGGVWLGPAPQQRPAWGGRPRLLLCSAWGEPRARSLAQGLQQTLGTLSGRPASSRPEPPPNTGSSSRAKLLWFFSGHVRGGSSRLSRLSPGSRHSEAAGDVPARPTARCPSDKACKNGHYFLPNWGKIKLQKKSGMHGDSTAESLNGGRAEMLLPGRPTPGRQPAAPGRRAGSRSAPGRMARGDPVSPGLGRLTAHSAACLSFVASWSQEYYCRSFRFR